MKYRPTAASYRPRRSSSTVLGELLPKRRRQSAGVHRNSCKSRIAPEQSESWKYKTVAKTLQQEKRLEKDKRQYANEKLLSPPNTVSNPDVAQLGDEAGERSYWLMKAEPNSRIEKGVDVKFSIDDLKNVTAPEPWEGVRNHVAKNNMKAMKKGDLAFFYHSNCKTPGIAGVMEIVRETTVDESAFDEKNPYYDAKSTRDNPRWFNVHVSYRQKFPSYVSLKQLQLYAVEHEAIKEMQLLRQSRLSVSKVSPSAWSQILELGKKSEEHG